MGTEENNADIPPSDPSESGYSDPGAVWLDETDAEIARRFAGFRPRYCPRCHREYDGDVDRCKHDGEPLRDRSVFACRIADEIFDATSFSGLFERTCPRCGKVFDLSLTHCPEDGTALQLRYRPSEEAEEEADPSLMVGRTFGNKWQVLEFISGGGFGWVYRGMGLGLGQPVAIKVLKINLAASPRYRKLFHAEATILSQLDSPRIVRIVDYGEEDETPFLVMQYLSDRPLHTLVQENSLSIRDKAEIMRQVALALAEAHREDRDQGIRRVVHLDLKPDHIFVRRREEELHVTVVDFGIANIIAAAEGNGDAPHRGRIVGTFPYMAGERFDGVVDPRSDIYSFGIVFFELLAGTKPCDATEPAEYEYWHKNELPPPLHRDAVGEKIPGQLRRLVERCMAKRMEDRPQTAREVAREIKAYQVRERRGKVLLRAGLAVAIALLLVASYLYLRPPASWVGLEINGVAAGEFVKEPLCVNKDLHKLPAYFPPGTSGTATLSIKGMPSISAPIQEDSWAEIELDSLEPGYKHVGRIQVAWGLRRVWSRPFRLYVDRTKPSFTFECGHSKDDTWVPISETPVVVTEESELTVKIADKRLKEASYAYGEENPTEEHLPRKEKTIYENKECASGKAETTSVPIAVRSLSWRDSRQLTLAFNAKDCAGNESIEQLTLHRIEPGIKSVDIDPCGEAEMEDGRKRVYTYLQNPQLLVEVVGKPGSLDIYMGGERLDIGEDLKPAPLTDHTYLFTVPLTGLMVGKNSLRVIAEDLLGRNDSQEILVELFGVARERPSIRCDLDPADDRIRFSVTPEGRRTINENTWIEITRIQENQRPHRIRRHFSSGTCEVYPVTTTLLDGEYWMRGHIKDMSGYAIDLPRESLGRFIVDTEGREITVDEEISCGHIKKPVILGTEEKAVVRFTVESQTDAEVEVTLGDEPINDIIRLPGRNFEAHIPSQLLLPYKNTVTITTRRLADPQRCFSSKPPETKKVYVFAMKEDSSRIISIDPDEDDIALTPTVRIRMKLNWTIAEFDWTIAAAGVGDMRQVCSGNLHEEDGGEPWWEFETAVPRPESIKSMQLEVNALSRRPEAATKNLSASRNILLRPSDGNVVAIGVPGRTEIGKLPMKFLEKPELFFICDRLVSQREYYLFAKDTGRLNKLTAQLDPETGKEVLYNKNSDNPVGGVSYDDAKEYCTWLGKGLFRLATNAEWDAMVELADVKGLKKLGLYILCEWVKPDVPDYFVVRGVSWEMPPKDRENLKKVKEHRFNAQGLTDRSIYYGFRVALSLDDWIHRDKIEAAED